MPNRKRDDGYTVTRRNGHHDRPWGQPVEVPLNPDGYHRYRWVPLAEELALRLERTDANHALEVPIPNPGHLKRAREALWFWFKMHCGKNAVLIHCRIEPDGSGTLLVRRGPKWGRLPDHHLEEPNE